MKTFNSIALSLLLLTPFGADAAVKLPSLLTDGMVVQQGRPLTLWGTATPGEEVKVKVVKGKSTTTNADEQGQWAVELPALKTGKTYTIKINDQTIENVAVGEVLLCSGQSNMELPVNRVTDMFADEVAAYSNPAIRHFNVPKELDFHTRRTDCNSSWKAVDPNSAMGFSALAYFTAKELNARTGLPVGIIHASWGGTPVESWISEEYLADYPRVLNEKRLYEDDAYRESMDRMGAQHNAQWNALLYTSDPGRTATIPWYSVNLDDSNWTPVLLPVGGVFDGTADLPGETWATDINGAMRGSHWLRHHFTLTSDQASREGLLRLGCLVDADSVYINGKFVGTTGYQYPPRKYKVPAGVLRAGDNVVTVRLITKSSPAHFVPDKPYLLALGCDTVSMRGTWLHRTGARMPSCYGYEFWCYKPTVLFNAMISPVLRYPIGGVVWYQGESNISRRFEYASLLGTMIDNWRHDFNDRELPFYIVELADFLHPNDLGRRAWAEMRAEQAKLADSKSNTQLIHNSDLGEWNDIHPLDKKTLAGRVVDAILNQKN